MIGRGVRLNRRSVEVVAKSEGLVEGWRERRCFGQEIALAAAGLQWQLDGQGWRQPLEGGKNFVVGFTCRMGQRA